MFGWEILLIKTEEEKSPESPVQKYLVCWETNKFEEDIFESYKINKD